MFPKICSMLTRVNKFVNYSLFGDSIKTENMFMFKIG